MSRYNHNNGGENDDQDNNGGGINVMNGGYRPDENHFNNNGSTNNDNDDGVTDINQQQKELLINVPSYERQPRQQHNIPTPIQDTTDTTKIAMVIFFYFFISISLVFLNKALMKNLEFNYPLFITWYQQIVSFAMIYIMCKVSKGFDSLSFLPEFEFKKDVAWKVLPLTTVLTFMIIFNNLCLEYVEVSFYQIARSLTICFSLILTYYILGNKTSAKATMACGVVFFGFVLGSVGEVNFSWLGIIFGLLSSFFVALYSIYVKRVLPVCDSNEWKLSIYNTAISIGLILPLIILSGESATLLDQEIIYTGQFWVVMTLAGAMGYLISIAIFMQIKHTSPLTNSISGTVKACVQTILAVMVWGNEITFQNAMGIALVIFGSFYYSFVRYQEMKKN